MGQWMAGFCRAMREETDQNSKIFVFLYHMMPKTFPGALQKPAMQCCFVIWNRERLKIILKLSK